MVSWGKAFKSAGLYVIFLIVWTVVGAALIAFGYITYGSLIWYDPYTKMPKINPAGLNIGFVLTLIGSIIILLGSFATFFKIVSEIVADEVEERLRYRGL